MAQWLALSRQSKKVSGSNPACSRSFLCGVYMTVGFPGTPVSYVGMLVVVGGAVGWLAATLLSVCPRSAALATVSAYHHRFDCVWMNTGLCKATLSTLSSRKRYIRSNNTCTYFKMTFLYRRLFISWDFYFLMPHIFWTSHLFLCCIYFQSYMQARGAWLSSDQSSCTRSKAVQNIDIDNKVLNSLRLIEHCVHLQDVQVVWRVISAR